MHGMLKKPNSTHKFYKETYCNFWPHAIQQSDKNIATITVCGSILYAISINHHDPAEEFEEPNSN